MTRTMLLAGAALFVWAGHALADAPNVKVRFGAHPTYERMVFDWPARIGYRAEQRGRSVAIEFETAAKIDAAALRKGLARVAEVTSLEVEEGRVRLSLELAEGLVVKPSRNGAKIVFDFARGVAPSVVAEGPVAAAPGAVAAVPPPVARDLPATAAVAEPPPAPAEAADDVHAVAAIAPAAAPPSERAVVPPKESKAAAPAAGPNKVPAPTPAASTKTVSEPPQLAAPPAVSAEPSEPAAAKLDTVPVDVVRTVDGFGLRFGWTAPVAAAVFARGEALWVVFDRKAQLDLERVNARRDDVASNLAVVESEGLAVRLVPNSPPAAASVRREGDAWVVDLRGNARRAWMPGAGTEARVSVRSPGDQIPAALVVQIDGVRATMSVSDPEAGDTIVVAPTTAAGVGVPGGRQFPQLRLLASAQGAAMIAASDGLSVRPLGNGFEVTAAGAIEVSATALAAANAARPAAARGEGGRLFDFESWRRGPTGEFVGDRQALQRAVATAANTRRNAARLDLARFLFANGYGTDALGLMTLVAEDDPGLATTTALRAMRGAAALMADDLQVARELLDPSLDGNAEATFWRAALAVVDGGPMAAAGLFAAVRDFSAEYPAPFANRLGLLVAEARLAGGDVDAARQRLDVILASSATAFERAEVDYLRARALAEEGKTEEAVAAWRAIERGANGSARIAAALSRIETLRTANKITTEAAIDELDRLRFGWRGDAREFAVLAQLGRLQIETGDIRSGLQNLRQAVTYFPQYRESRELLALMSAAFERALLGPGSGQVPPLVAIGLYDEFRELAPTGPRGVEMLMDQADRMIAADLLDRAATTLGQLSRMTLPSAQKATVGARLALVMLLSGEAGKAFAALEQSDGVEVRGALKEERARLEARALSELGEAERALARIDGQTGTEVDELRAEILWRARDWRRVTEAIERLIPRQREGEALSDGAARRVLQLAVASALSGDEAGLRRVRERYTPALAGGPYASLLDALTSDRPEALADMATIAARVAAATSVRSFLTAYRERLAGLPARRS